MIEATPTSRGSPRYATARFIVTAFVLWRVALLTVGWAAVVTLPERPDLGKQEAAFPNNRVLESLVRWDSGWYSDIAKDGYHVRDAPRQSDVAFFPAYPYLSRWLGYLVGGNYYFAGILISHLATLVALFFVYGIARKYFDEEDARRAVLLVLCFPTSVFLCAFYSEGLFFMAVCGAFFFYERDRLLPAALFGSLAAMTRSSGVLLLPALLVGALHRREWRWRTLTPRLLWLLLIAGGLGAVMIVYAVQTGDPLAFQKAQGAWQRGWANPLVTLFAEAQRMDWAFPASDARHLFRLLDLAAAVGLFAVAALALRRFDAAYSLFALGSVLLPLSSGRVLSMGRFAAPVITVYLVLTAATERPLADRFVLYASTLLLALHTILFATWYWAG